MSRKIRHSHISHDRWLVSYADFITLLFAFFVVMFASSRQDQSKVRQVESSIREAFQSMGVFPANSHQPNSSSATVIPSDSVAMVTLGDDAVSLPGVMEDLSHMKQRMEQTLAPQIANGAIAITLGRGGLLISLRDVGFFDSGSAIPKSSSIPTLNVIGRGMATVPYDVRIEGHTDDVPIQNSQYPSNWELSTARATVLTRFFIEEDHILPGRLSAAGYAQYHPIASNLTAEGRSRNRRIDIIVLPTRQLAGTVERVFTGHDRIDTSFSAGQKQPPSQDVLWRISQPVLPSSTPTTSGSTR
jgi:chemotaxis protein MotB